MVAVGLGDRHYARLFRDETHITFPLLIDERRKAYAVADLKSATIWSLFSRVTAEHRRRAKAGGHSQQRLGRNPFQLGGSFVFLPGDVDRYAHISQSFGDNAPVDDLLNALRTPVT